MVISRIKNLSNPRFLIKRSIYGFIKEKTQGKHYQKVYDIGGGRSPYKKCINYNEYIVVDNENRTEKHNILLADANNVLPIDDNSADLIILTEVLEHIKKPDCLLREIHRILKPGGEMLLTTPFFWGLHEEPNDFFRYTKYGLEDLLKGAGFKDYEIKKSSGYFYALLQLFMLNMRKKIFIPIVFILNLAGLFFYKTEKKKNFYLSNFVFSRK